MIHINSKRLMGTIGTLGEIGETADGVQRLAFSSEDKAGRQYVQDLMLQAGLKVKVDAAGNIRGRVEGRCPDLPAIGVGSHTDTVPNGGKYDGALGVLGAVECINRLREESIVTRHSIEVLDFTNEEGTGFKSWLWGSRAMTGRLNNSDFLLTDHEGVSIGERLQGVGGDIYKIEDSIRKQGDYCVYLELHIEQGPILHQTRIPIGVVTGITGRIALEVTIQGFANHAGTTPMGNRYDALLGASHVIQAVNSIATQDEICRVATVGIIRANPNAENVIPGKVNLSVEFRDSHIQRLNDGLSRLRDICHKLGLDQGLDVNIRQLGVTNPVPMDHTIQELIGEVSSALGFKTRSIPSGAGHDAQSMAEITRAGMIFVPSVDGVSHSPKEFSTDLDCANGTTVLLNTILASDENLD